MKSLSDIPYERLIGKTAISAYHENNSVFIGFSDESSISIYTGRDRFLNQFPGGPHEKESAFSSIIGKSVSSAESKGKGSLILTFDNEIEIEIKSDEMPYESYLLYIDGSTFPV